MIVADVSGVNITLLNGKSVYYVNVIILIIYQIQWSHRGNRVYCYSRTSIACATSQTVCDRHRTWDTL